MSEDGDLRQVSQVKWWFSRVVTFPS